MAEQKPSDPTQQVPDQMKFWGQAYSFGHWLFLVVPTQRGYKVDRIVASPSEAEPHKLGVIPFGFYQPPPVKGPTGALGLPELDEPGLKAFILGGGNYESFMTKTAKAEG